MSDAPGIGIIGQGFMGRAHALVTLGHMTGPPFVRPRLVSVAGRDERVLRGFAERFGFARATTDYRQSWGADPAVVGAWRFRRDAAGGGALGDLASHVIDLARYVVGDLASIAAETATFVAAREVDDAVRFAGGAVGTTEATRFATGEENRFTWEVNGSRGWPAFDLERPGEPWIDGRRELADPADWWPRGHVLGCEHTFVSELRRVLDAVAGRCTVAPHAATFHDGVRAAEACDRGPALGRGGPARQPAPDRSHRMKTSLGTWALGPMVTRFAPAGCQPERVEPTHEKVAAVRRSVLQRRFIDGVAARIDEPALRDAQARKDAVAAYELVYAGLGA